MRDDLTENEIGIILITTAIDIHRSLGSGLFESVYETVLAHDLEEKGLTVKREVLIGIEYKDYKFEEAFRADLILNDKVIVELKSIEQLTMSHRKQLLTYLRLSRKKLGYLLNFGEALMKDGIVRIVNGLAEENIIVKE
jgi:GxxExxY protein